MEKTGDALGFPSARIEEDLKRFRDYIEERGRETGGWKGQVKKGNGTDMNVLPTTGSRLEAETDQPYADKHVASETKVSVQP